MIFRKGQDNKLTPVKNIGFKLEKDIQTLVENNMDVLFGLRFLETEFTIADFRFDSVAFDDETNSFVIIEDKNVENKGLVDQGYAYLKTALDRKADLVLLYNRKTGQSKQIDDFEWDQISVIFVSPKFSRYQTEAVNFQGMPFRLYRISQYKDGIIDLEEIKERKVKEDPLSLGTGDSDIKTVAREVKVYTEDHNLEKADEETKELYQKLKDKASDIDTFDIVPRKLYIAYKINNTNVFDVQVEKRSLAVFLNLKSGELDGQFDDSKLSVKNVSKTGHWGNGDYKAIVQSEDQLDYLIPLIRLSYKKNS